MNRPEGIGRVCIILVLLLSLPLICSSIAFAQWKGPNNIPDTTTNSGDNTNTAVITAVATAADGSSATITINPIVNNNGGVAYLVGDTVAVKLSIAGVTDSTLSKNVLVAAGTTATQIVVTPPTGSTFTAGLARAATGSITLVLADPTTYLPAQSFSGDTHCLSCHSMPVLYPTPLWNPNGGAPTPCSIDLHDCGPLETNGYLRTGHKNMLRKVLPPGVLATSGASPASMGNDTLPYLQNGGFDWTAGTFNGNPLLYAVAWLASTTEPYPVVMNQGVVLGGKGAPYSCARCHTTGYRFDSLGPEPTYTTGTTAAPVYNVLSDAQLPRTPTGWTSGTASWQFTGVQCERCHGSSHTDCKAAVPPIPYPKIGGQTVSTCNAWQDGSGNWHQSKTYQPVNVAATALCIECHRQEGSTTTGMTNGGVTVPAHTIEPAQLPGQNLPGWPTVPGPGSLGAVSDNGSCSVSQTPKYTYSQCIKNGGTWTFALSMGHGANGAQTFLNSPHARFTGTLQQNAQNSPDRSIQLNGTFSSRFTDWGEGMGEGATSGNNAGCTGCHNPHYSAVSTNNPPATPIIKHCQDCHKTESSGYDFGIHVVNHPTGEGTPLPNGLSSSDSSPCVVCHMGAASGTPLYHYFRINEDPNYYTFGPASVWYAKSDTPGNGQPNTYTEADHPDYPAVGLDVDIACGQCHLGGSGGSNGTKNPYGIVVPASSAPAMSRETLAAYAKNMHATFLLTVPPSATGVKGQPLTLNVILTPRNGITLSNPVTLGVSGLPANATYSWSVNPVSLLSGSTSSILTITVPLTTAQLGPQGHSRPFLPLSLPLFGAAIGSVLLGYNKKKCALLGLVLLISLAGAGCGSGTTTTTTHTTSPAFTVMVNATSGPITVSSPIPVTMN